MIPSGEVPAVWFWPSVVRYLTYPRNDVAVAWSVDLWMDSWSQEANLSSPSGSEAKLSSCLLVFFQTVASPALSRQLNGSEKERVVFHCSFRASISVQV